MPYRDAVAPPKLARNAPIADIGHPIEENLALVFRRDRDLAVFDGRSSDFRERLHLAEPLRGNARLDHRFAAVANRYGVRVIFHAFQQAERLEIGHHALAGFKAVKPGVDTGVRIHARVFRHHVDFREIVAAAHLEVVRIVRRRHFHRAGTELPVDRFVRNDGNFAIGERQTHFLADQALITLVRGMYRDGRVAKHRFRPRSSDYDAHIAAGHGIAKMPQMATAFLMHGFQVTESRLAARAPIDDVSAAIDQLFVVKTQKGFEHGAIERRIEGKLFARPIDRIAQPDHLLQDRAAAVRLPIPYAALKFLAAQLRASDFLLGQFAFDDDLRGNPCVVHSGQPERAKSAHAMPTRQRINLRVLEHVADVNVAGDVRRWNHDAERRAVRAFLRAKESGIHPLPRPALLNLLRLVSFGDLSGHKDTRRLHLAAVKHLLYGRRLQRVNAAVKAECDARALGSEIYCVQADNRLRRIPCANASHFLLFSHWAWWS